MYNMNTICEYLMETGDCLFTKRLSFTMQRCTKYSHSVQMFTLFLTEWLEL